MVQPHVSRQVEEFLQSRVPDSKQSPVCPGREELPIARNVQHELRSALNVIIGYSDLILGALADATDTTHGDWLQGMGRGTDRLLATVSAILDYLELLNGGPQIRPESVALGGVVRLQVERLRPAAEAKGLAFSFRDETPGASVFADKRCLSRALGEIVSNAVKFTDRGRVHVLLCRISGGLCVQVRDTGAGISEDFQPKLFQPFCQEGGAENRRFNGLGLGLVLAKAMLESNGAKLTFKSEGGWGSTFSIWFPRLLEAAAHPAVVRPPDDLHPSAAAGNGQPAGPRNGQYSPEA